MARLKYSRDVGRGKRPRRQPIDAELELLEMVAQGVVKIGEMIEYLASGKRLSRRSAERIVRNAIVAGILDILELI